MTEWFFLLTSCMRIFVLMLDYRRTNNGGTNSSHYQPVSLRSTYSSDCRPEAVGQLSERAEILLETLEL